MTTLPRTLPNGQYLLRVERIDLQAASGFPPYFGGELIKFWLNHQWFMTSLRSSAQFYLACAQVNIVNGGNGILPEKKLAIPGHYAQDVSPIKVLGRTHITNVPGCASNLEFTSPKEYSSPEGSESTKASIQEVYVVPTI